MGLTVPDAKRTAVAIPESFPVGTIDFSVRLQHKVEFKDINTPRSKAKPRGMHGCEIWMKLGDPEPKEASELDFVATSTRTPYKVEFTGADVGKTVHYWLRWINKKGKPGPWSSPINAMVVGQGDGLCVIIVWYAINLIVASFQQGVFVGRVMHTIFFVMF